MLVRLKPISRKWLVFVSVWEERPDSLHISIPVGANINLQTSKSQNVLLFSYEWIWDRVQSCFHHWLENGAPCFHRLCDRRNKTVLLKVEEHSSSSWCCPGCCLHLIMELREWQIAQILIWWPCKLKSLAHGMQPTQQGALPVVKEFQEGHWWFRPVWHFSESAVRYYFLVYCLYNTNFPDLIG